MPPWDFCFILICIRGACVVYTYYDVCTQILRAFNAVEFCADAPLCFLPLFFFFLLPLLVMAQVSHHKHLVSLIGVITRGDPLVLVVSYCEHGSLLG